MFISLRPPESVESLSAVLKEIEAVPTYMPNCLLLRDSVNRATEWLKEAEALQVKHIEDLSSFINARFSFTYGECNKWVLISGFVNFVNVYMNKSIKNRKLF